MSIRTMTRQCVHCRRTYTYNPSVGDLGFICKYCLKVQTRLEADSRISRVLADQLHFPEKPEKPL